MNNLFSNVSGVFLWDLTKEGMSYWDLINRRLNNLELEE